jgi:hypothetical protein
MRRFFLPQLAGLCLAAAVPAADEGIPEWAKGIEIGVALSADQLVVSDPAAWKVLRGEAGDSFVELTYDKKAFKSSYTPKHRSPVHIALLKSYNLTDFVMDLEVQSTVEPYGHQDLCLFFGFESPERYYYAHIARAADPNAHNVFIVNDAPRKNIAKETTKGVDWKKGTWHKVRLVRQGTTGRTEVYFDDLKKPVMTAEDRTFPKGFVGFGSFDDVGRFRNVIVYTKNLVVDKPPEFFKPPGK